MSRLSRISFRAAQRQYDSMCPPERTAVCECCERTKDYGKTFFNDRFVCEDCLPNVCNECGEEHPEHPVTINGKLYCKACTEA